MHRNEILGGSEKGRFFCGEKQFYILHFAF